MTRLLRSPRWVAAAGLALLWCGSSAVLAIWFSGRVRDWTVMTDELQYAKLALSIADSGSPLPAIHGASVAATNQLYPLLLAPLYGSLSSTDAFRAAHVLNAVVMTSAAVPAYLLARQLLGRGWSFAVSALTVVVPWMVLTGMLMSEVAAYPAFLWAMLAFQRALVEPSPGRDLVAVAALGGAILARAQFAALALALALAVVLVEIQPSGGRPRLLSGLRTALRRHRWLWASYAVAAVAAAVVAVSGYGLLGAYATTVEGGSVLPSGLWWSAVEHLAAVGIGSGVVPLVLGGGWLLAAVAGARGPHRSFATVSLLAVLVLTVETASFDLRFGGEDVIRDRYLFYVVPLLLVAAAAALRDPRRPSVAIGAGVMTAVLGAGAAGLPYPTFPRVSVDTPVSVFNEVLIDQSGGLGVGTFAALLVAGVGLTVALGLLVVPRGPLALVAAGLVLGFSVVLLHSEADRMLGGTSLTERPFAGPPGAVLDWVDAVVPEGEEAALIPFPVSTDWGASAIQWWDVEFWNRTVTRAYRAPDGNFTYTTFPLRTLEVDPVNGLVDGSEDAPGYVVTVPSDPRVGLAGREHAANAGFRVLAVERPYRATWASSGLQTDGWSTPGRPVSVRVYGEPGSPRSVVRLRITLRAPAEAPIRYRLSAETADRQDVVAAGAATDETVVLCVAPGEPVDATITSLTGAVAAGPPLGPDPGPRRRVGVSLGPIAVEPTGRPCGT